jgi:hypothetical protein
MFDAAALQNWIGTYKLAKTPNRAESSPFLNFIDDGKIITGDLKARSTARSIPRLAARKYSRTSINYHFSMKQTASRSINLSNQADIPTRNGYDPKPMTSLN